MCYCIIRSPGIPLRATETQKPRFRSRTQLSNKPSSNPTWAAFSDKFVYQAKDSYASAGKSRHHPPPPPKKKKTKKKQKKQKQKQNKTKNKKKQKNKKTKTKTKQKKKKSQGLKREKGGFNEQKQRLCSP